MLVNNRIKVRWMYAGKKTSCVVSVKEEGETPTFKEIQISSTRCHKKDIQDKKEGRLISFRRAMREIMLRNKIPREERTNVWGTFFNTITQP